MVVLALCACTQPEQAQAGDDPIKLAFAERVTDLIDTGPAGPMVLLPGASDPGRQFAAALALARYQTAVPYLAQLSDEWASPDSLYGPKGQLSTQVDVTRLAALLARSAAEYRAVLFPADRLAALRDRVATIDEPASRSSLSQTLTLLDGHSTVDCGKLTTALLERDFAAVSRLIGPAPESQCGTPRQAVVDIARTEVARGRGEILGWRVPDPGQVIELGTRLSWVASYSPEALRSLLAPVADALADYLTQYAEESAPFLPNIPPDQLQLLFDLMHNLRPEWRPANGYLAQLNRTLQWRGRLPDHVRNDPTTFVYSLELLANAARPEIIAALPRLRTNVIEASDGTALDLGLRAIAARRGDLITDDVLTRAALAVGEDVRLGARLAAVVIHRGECPSEAGRVLDGLQRAAPNAEELSATYVYYYALIAQAHTRCSGGTSPPPVLDRLRAASDKYAGQVTDVLAKPDWPGWFQLWLLAEASCALERPPTLDAPRMTEAARTMLSGPTEQVWSKFDPNNAYALSRSLGIARNGCRGAWFTVA